VTAVALAWVAYLTLKGIELQLDLEVEFGQRDSEESEVSGPDQHSEQPPPPTTGPPFSAGLPAPEQAESVLQALPWVQPGLREHHRPETLGTALVPAGVDPPYGRVERWLLRLPAPTRIVLDPLRLPESPAAQALALQFDRSAAWAATTARRIGQWVQRAAPEPVRHTKVHARKAHPPVGSERQDELLELHQRHGPRRGAPQDVREDR